MIDRQGKKIIVECDSCDETVESEDGEEWRDFWPRIRRDGWKARSTGGEWTHGCPRHPA